MQARDFIKGFITAHEGGLSMHPEDSGNWYQGVLVGSKYGVTANALLAYAKRNNVPPSVVKTEIANLTLDTAVDIGFQLYYSQPGFDKLVWNQVTASIMDKAWGSGPGQAIKLMQRMIGVSDDGKIGPGTANAFNAWISKNGVEKCALTWCNVRVSFDHSLLGPHPEDAKFINGWDSRSKSFLPGTVWWKSF